jgi:REP element-mobilizing transposase RayT
MDEFRFRRRNLPHWEIAGATYFVTFRLASSLPAAVVEEWRREREQLRLGRLTASVVGMIGQEEHIRLARLCHAKFDAQLDGAGYGPKHLSDPGLAGLVADALRFHQGARYDLFAFAVMPNHAHVVLRPCAKPDSRLLWGLDEIMRSIKGYTGKKANERHGAHGEFWQREYYDHMIRNEEEWCYYVDYTRQNPVQAGLCARAEDWPWSSADLPVGVDPADL